MNAKEDCLRKAISCLAQAESLLRAVSSKQDAYFIAADAAKEAHRTAFQARRQAATALGLLLTHNQ